MMTTKDYIGGVSTRKVDFLLAVWVPGNSMSQLSRICQDND